MNYRWDWAIIFREHEAILKGLALTLELTVLCFLLTISLSLIMSFGRISKNRFFYAISTAYVEYTRNVPQLVHIFIFFFGLASIGIGLTAIQAGILALSFHSGGYITEIFRGAILSVGEGQVEAAESLAMTWLQYTRRIILPQAFRCAIPALGNELVYLMKDTSLLFAIGVGELFFQGFKIITYKFAVFEVYIAIGFIYLGVSFAVGYALKIAERKYSQFV